MSLLGLGSASLYYGIGDDSSVYAVAIFAAIFHLVNHSTFKGCLFMVVGIIDHETGTRDIRRLGGLDAPYANLLYAYGHWQFCNGRPTSI